MRGAIAEGDAPADRHFAIKVRGGEWCMAHFGVPFNESRGEACPKDGKAFCVLYRIAQSCTFTLSVYGEHGATILEDYWVSKVHFFSAMRAHRGVLRYAFTDDDVAQYRESAEFGEYACSVGGAILARIAALRAIRPNLV